MLDRFKKVQKKCFLAISLVLATTILYIFDIRQVTEPKMGVVSNLTASGFLVHTAKCRIPDLDAFDDAVKGYFELKPHFSCAQKPPLIESNQTSIWVVESALRQYEADNVTSLDCCYTPFWRNEIGENEENLNSDNKITYSDTCVHFIGSANIYHEFVRVTCKLSGTAIYTDFHAFVVPKNPKGEMEKESGPGVSMMVIGVDSVSRLNFHRQLTRTRKTLRSLKAIEFFGYNKVHDNTFPNLMPVLSGQSVDNIKKMCWFHNSLQFDRCPFIWKKLNAKGYLTAFAEDSSWMGIFNYLKKGFLREPTDYYLRPYIMTNEDEIGHSRLGNSKYCCGVRFAAQVLFEYAYKFVVNMTSSGKKSWGFFWETSLTHDFINIYPNADELLDDLLVKMNGTGVLDNTVVFLMSDHGIRWGPIRETFQGWLEERLPFLFVLLPKWLQEKYPEAMANLRRNTRALTTHYDVHETMLDLMNLTTLESEELKNRANYWNRRAGLSLFLPISGDRTCRNADIPTEWCTCHESSVVSVQNSLVQRAAATLVKHVNDLLAPYVQCARLTLKMIHSARVDHSRLQENEMKKKARVVDYIVVLSTEPGDGKFEGTVRHRTDSDKLSVQGYVSRINMYGSQSRCVLDYNLRLYCYCT